jgi:hypothetical protein
MARPSSNPDKARSGGGVEAGNYEVTKAEYRNCKSDLKSNQPTLVFEAAVLDDAGDLVRGAEPVEMFFGMGARSAEAFHPGQCKGPLDDQPEDLGGNVDTAGNTIFCAGDEQFNRSCGYIVFNEALAKAGFPKTVLDQTYAPNYVGLKFALKTMTSKEINDRFGTRLNTKPMPDGGIVTYKVCDRWLNPAYLSAGSQQGQAEAGTKSVAAGTAAATAATTAEDTAKAVLATLAKKKPGAKGAIKTPQALVGFATNEFTKAKCPASMLAAVQGFFKDQAWVEDNVIGLGGMFIDGVTTFPEVATPAA